MKIFRTYERELELAQLFIRADDRELTLIAVWSEFLGQKVS